MAHGHSGFIALYENDSWGGGTAHSPVPLFVESESLGINKTFHFQRTKVGPGRVYGTEVLISGPIAPEGEIVSPLRAGDCLQVLLSHFQTGTLLSSGTGTNTFNFMPSKGQPNWDDGASSTGTYGATNYIYSVSFLKKFYNNTATNSHFYKYGVCDKLSISCGPNDYAKIRSSYKFRSVDTGTQVGTWFIPNSGSYLSGYGTGYNFPSWAGTVLYNSVGFDLNSINVTFNNNLQTKSVLGAQNPSFFPFGKHEVGGDLDFDLPTDGMKYFGSMLSAGSFALSLRYYRSGVDSVAISMPFCRSMPFESNSVGDALYKLRIPFKAFENNGTPSVTITVITSGTLAGFASNWDAWIGTRNVPDFLIHDAGTAARTLTDYSFFDRDI